jgi:DNA-binding NarL/FixJ family response regulator
MRDKSSSPVRPAKRRILIVDDHSLVRRGLTALIDNEPDLIVCAEGATHRSGLEAIASSRPDLVIADLRLGPDDGLALVRDVRSGNRDLPILVLSMHEAPTWTQRAIDAGANGYVSKQEMGETLLLAIRCVLGGERYEGNKGNGGTKGNRGTGT